MHLHFEEPSSRLRCDSVINSLSWMGRVPDEQPEGHGWKLNRTSYYQEGWLAAGNVKSVVGVTFTSTLPNRSNPTAAWSSSNAPAAHPTVSSAAAFQLPLPPRTNYNLRGHRAQISLVRWNEPYQKLATCDASGIIFVWIRYEGRWSIELINDRNRPVTHFSWSHDGRMAVIAYQDGFVLVGSVAGQRYWSTFLNQDYVITTGTWTPDDQQVYLATSNGMIVVLDVRNGDVIAEIQMTEPIPPPAGSSSVRANGTSASSTPPSWSPSSTPPSSATLGPSATSTGGSPSPNGIRQLAWNCPRFKMEEPANAPAPTARSSGTDLSGASRTDPSVPPLPVGASAEEQHVLAVLTFAGRLSLIKGFDDVHPCYAGIGDDDEPGCDAADGGLRCDAPLLSPMMEWNNDGELLCLAGHYCPSSGASSNGNVSGTPAAHYVNVLQFYNSRGVLRFRINVPYTQAPITSITWGHNDRRLFVATGCMVHVAWVSPRRMASLQHLARLRLRRCLKSSDQLDRIADRLPKLMRSLVATLFNSTIHCHVPEEQRIREFVCRPAPANTRLYCTMIRREDESASDIDSSGIDPNAAASSGGSGVAFTLYLEFLGGLIPLLKGKPTSRLRPEFVILDPQLPASSEPKAQSEHHHEPNKSPETLLPPPQPSVGLTAASKLTQLLSPALQRKFRRPPRPSPDSNVTIGGDSDSETEESCVSTPRLQRKFGAARKYNHQAANHNAPPDASAAQSTDAKHHGENPLAEIASNIWGTRFKISGFPPTLPFHLGQVTYKTSLLHLQPRQMTLGVVDLRNPQPGDVSSSEDNSTAFSPSDDEETCSSTIKETETSHLAPIVPLATPNLRLRRKAPRRMEPPPAPTHHRRPVDPNQVLDEMVHMELSDATPERVVLSAPVVRWRSLSVGHIVHRESSTSRSHKRRKSRSLDSSPVIRPYVHQKPVLPSPSVTKRDRKKMSASFRIGSQVQQSVQQSDGGAREKHRFALARLSPLFGRRCPSKKSPLTEPSTPNSSPAVDRRRNNQTATKTDRRQSPIRQLLNSPLLARRLGRGRFSSNPQVVSDSSDDDDAETTTAYNYHDLESFQKAQLLNKLKQSWLAEKNAAALAPVIKEVQLPKKRREFILNNKAPLWNEHSQVYQLDFGGRVTQESAKNFQIEFKGKQVMQFGRIDGNAYTLDFQYPFSAVQAFAVALANVTQRLK